jgi:CheY-like chemotaxis protein
MISHKHMISHNHSITIDTEGHLVSGYTKTMDREPVYGSKPAVSQGELPTRIIIAEPYPDLQQFYSLWLRSRGFKDMIITDSGKKCVDEFFKSTNDDEDTKCSSNNFPREAVLILDTHLEDISSIQVAKQIFDRNPDQQVIFTTTLPSDIISQEISAAGLSKCSAHPIIGPAIRAIKNLITVSSTVVTILQHLTSYSWSLRLLVLLKCCSDNVHIF